MMTLKFDWLCILKRRLPIKDNTLLDVYIRSGISNSKRTMRTVDLADKRFNSISSSLEPSQCDLLLQEFDLKVAK